MDADAIVIGAGAAGLAAARRLAEQNLRVVLLEARDRIGGRVFARPVDGLATPPQLGAEFIHGKAPKTIALLHEIASAAIDLGEESWSRANGGLERENDDFTAAAAIFQGALSLPEDESVDRFLRRFDSDAAMRATVALARAFVEGFEAADPADASVKAIATEWASGADSTSARPLGGYAPIFARLRDACTSAGVQILLATRVRRILRRRGSVAIEAIEASGRTRTYEAPAAVVTLPVGVLRHDGDASAVVFDPDLPQRKRNALRQIAMGHVKKVELWFRSAFWERISGGCYRDAAFFRSDQSFRAYWTQLPVRSELVVAWAGGPRATAMQGYSEDELVATAVDGFGALFDETALARREFVGGATHDWNADPFARGAYSYVTVGGTDARSELAEPVDDALFFAGEATSTDGQGGTVNGALETGERAAAEVSRARER